MTTVGKTQRIKSLTEQLKEAIEESNMSLGEISRKSGVGTDRLSRFVRGERGMNADAIEKVFHALGLKVVAVPIKSK